MWVWSRYQIMLRGGIKKKYVFKHGQKYKINEYSKTIN